MDVANDPLVIPRPAARPTGQPPRCRQCGAICHASSGFGGSFERLCWGCSIRHANTEAQSPFEELRITDWYRGKAFAAQHGISPQRVYTDRIPA